MSKGKTIKCPVCSFTNLYMPGFLQCQKCNFLISNCSVCANELFTKFLGLYWCRAKVGRAWSCKEGFPRAIELHSHNSFPFGYGETSTAFFNGKPWSFPLTLLCLYCAKEISRRPSGSWDKQILQGWELHNAVALRFLANLPSILTALPFYELEKKGGRISAIRDTDWGMEEDTVDIGKPLTIDEIIQQLESIMIEEWPARLTSGSEYANNLT